MNPIRKCQNLWLAWLLGRAAQEMQRRGALEIPFTDFGTTADFAAFLSSAAARFRQGDTTDGERLWYLFAPTCSWDDGGGSQNLGNLIFGAVGRRFHPKDPVSTHSRVQKV
jgi:hypothetical protein